MVYTHLFGLAAVPSLLIQYEEEANLPGGSLLHLVKAPIRCCNRIDIMTCDVFRVLPSMKERCCFTIWLSQTRRAGALPTLPLSKLLQSGI